MGFISKKLKASDREQLVSTRRLQTALTLEEVEGRLSRWCTQSLDEDRERRIRSAEAGGKLKKWANRPEDATGYRLTVLGDFAEERADDSARAARLAAQKVARLESAARAHRFVLEHTSLTAFSRWYSLLDIVEDETRNAYVESTMLVWIVSDDGDVKGSELYLAAVDAIADLLTAEPPTVGREAVTPSWELTSIGNDAETNDPNWGAW